MLKITHEQFKPFIEVAKSKNLYIQGNILKVIDITDKNEEDEEYLRKAKEEFNNRSRENYKQQQDTLRAIEEAEKKSEINAELITKLQKKELELELALKASEQTRDKTLGELDALQKRSQTELRSKVIKYTLVFIGYILFIAPIVYLSVISFGTDNQATIMGNLLSNIFVSALSSTFGIIATILGLRAAEKQDKEKAQ